MVAKSVAFEKAITDSRKLKAKPTQDELLEVSYYFGESLLPLSIFFSSSVNHPR